MLDRVLSKIVCLAGSLWFNRQVKKYLKLKGVHGMKLVTTVKDFELKMVVNEAPKTIEDGKVIIGKPEEIMNFDFKLGESTTDCEMSQEEFLEVEEMVLTAAKDIRDNFLAPAGKALLPVIQKYADFFINTQMVTPIVPEGE